MAKYFDVYKSSGSKFYFRDNKNAARFRLDANPVRQKFQGYVNFVFNRDLFDQLYGEDVNNTEFRTTISSLVRNAELPSVQFQTETKNMYNRKRIVQTGVQYQPVSMTVYDTVGNEWLTTIMKYFSYHYMDPRNRTTVDSPRDLEGSRRLTDVQELDGTKFAFDENKFDSNQAGFNTNITKHFFERIDYVLYHGNQGVQYSIFNPVMTSFKPSEIDYADATGFREFQMSFEYEAFTTARTYNFGLSAEDLDRFENVEEFSKIKTFQEGTKAYTLSRNQLGDLDPGGVEVEFLGYKGTGNSSTEKLENLRTFQEQKRGIVDDFGDGNPDGSGIEQNNRSNTYGEPYVFSDPSQLGYANDPFTDALVKVANIGLSTAISDPDIVDASLTNLYAAKRAEILPATSIGSSSISPDADGNYPLPPAT